jgi:copper(I)-binding protein
MNLHRRTVLGALLGAVSAAAQAHDFKLGAIEIDHPYAPPTPAAARTAAVYFRTLKNRGDQPDRLVAASTPAAQSVEFHTSSVDAQNVMRMRPIEAIELPPRSDLRVRHGGELHLMLIELKAPLKEGDRFQLRLRFEKAGEREVTVWVQQPRGGVSEHRH